MSDLIIYSTAGSSRGYLGAAAHRFVPGTRYSFANGAVSATPHHQNPTYYHGFFGSKEDQFLYDFEVVDSDLFYLKGLSYPDFWRLRKFTRLTVKYSADLNLILNYIGHPYTKLKTYTDDIIADQGPGIAALLLPTPNYDQYLFHLKRSVASYTNLQAFLYYNRNNQDILKPVFKWFYYTSFVLNIVDFDYHRAIGEASRARFRYRSQIRARMILNPDLTTPLRKLVRRWDRLTTYMDHFRAKFLPEFFVPYEILSLPEVQNINRRLPTEDDYVETESESSGDEYDFATHSNTSDATDENWDNEFF